MITTIRNFRQVFGSLQKLGNSMYLVGKVPMLQLSCKRDTSWQLAVLKAVHREKGNTRPDPYILDIIYYLARAARFHNGSASEEEALEECWMNASIHYCDQFSTYADYVAWAEHNDFDHCWDYMRPTDARYGEAGHDTFNVIEYTEEEFLKGVEAHFDDIAGILLEELDSYEESAAPQEDQVV